MIVFFVSAILYAGVGGEKARGKVMKKELNVIFPNKSKEIVFIGKKNLSYDVKKMFIEELLRSMNENNLSDIKGIKISSEDMMLSFNRVGMDDFWGQNHRNTLSASLAEPERTVVCITPITRCAICKSKNCKKCHDVQIQTVINTIKTLQR